MGGVANMPSKIRDKTYHRLSGVAYLDEPNKKYSMIYEDGKEKWNLITDKSWKLHDTKTGFDATVFKNEKGKKIIVAYRGTEGDKILGRGFADVKTDAEYIVMHRPVNELGVDVEIKDKKLSIDFHRKNQFRQGDQLVKDVQKKYPDYKVSTTGHSLAGAIATYVAAENDLEAVTFNAPSVVALLPEEKQKKVEKGDYDKSIVNYVNPQDAIGAGALSEYERHIGSTYYIGSSYDLANAGAKQNPVLQSIRLYSSPFGKNYHGLKHFAFDSLGNISNPTLTNALTGAAEYQSPRFFSPEVATINVTPQDLKNNAEDLMAYVPRVEELCNHAKREITMLDNIIESEEVVNEVLQAIHELNGWFSERTNNIASNLNAAADSYVEADVLK